MHTFKGTITVPNTRTAAARNNRNKNVTFPDCIGEINNKEIDHAKDIDIMIPVYHLIEYSDNYLKTSESLW